MLQNIHLFGNRGFQTETLGQQSQVAIEECLLFHGLGVGNQFSHLSINFRAMGEQEQLVPGMKFHQNTASHSFL
jgi:hypothetical protein